MAEALRETWALPVIILGVLIGIFVGLFTPTEAGAVGAVLALLVSAAKGRLNYSVVIQSARQTLVSTASIFMVVIGTALLARCMAISGVPAFIADAFISMGTTPLLVVLAVALLYLVLGCFLDSIGILLLTMPIILPMARDADLDLIWFGILLVKLLEVGLLTPPVGLNVYIIKGALGDRVPLTTIFKGVGWFVVVDLFVLLFLIFVPEFTLWLPNQMQ